MRRKTSTIGGLVAAALLALAAAPAAADDWKSPVPFINVGGASVGTNAYQLAIKLAAMWSKIPGLKVTAVPGSSVANTRDLGLDRIQIGMTSMKEQHNAINGLGGYEAYPKLRYMLPWQLAHVVWIVRADSDIEALSDLRDKHVMPGAEGSTSKEAGLLSLECIGITPDSIRQGGGQVSFGAVGNNITLMQDRQLDAMIITVPREGMYTPVLPIENTVGVRLLPMDPKTVDCMVEKMPSLARGHVEGGIYKNQPERYDTIALGYEYSVRGELPEELVYRMTKMVWENADDIVATNPHFYIYGDINNAVAMANIPVHPGAARYYKERGIEMTPEQMPPSQ